MYKEGTVWEFSTARFTVTLTITPDYNYRYDGDDEDGEVQAKLDEGDFVAFNSDVTVYMDGIEIASDSLGGSVYDYDNVSDFWTAHRDSDPMNRNCSIMRGKHPSGPNVSIGHYFPGMVSEAIGAARVALSNVPELRKA